MALAAVSGASGSLGGGAALVSGVYVAAALVFLLAYRQVLAAASTRRRDLTLGLDSTGAALVVAFATIVAVRALVVAG